jgi:excisionase family DNA binding protein
MTSLAHDTPVLPPADVHTIDAVRDLLASSGARVRLLGNSGDEVDIPEELHQVLLSAVEAMRVGKAITVAPVNQTVTTQEAADFLGISRPSVVKLLNESRIPYERPAAGRHRRIRLSDLVDYQKRQRVVQSESLDAMVRIGESAGLYEDELPENYLDIITSVRRNRRA